jgi:predicted amidohydrolase YtcJ
MRNLLLLALLFLFSCQQKEIADTLYINGDFYTVNSAQQQAQALAVTGERILKVGSVQEIMALKGPKTQVIDLQGQFAMPGFIEGHGHFPGLGSGLMNLNFIKSKNWDEIVAMVAEKVKTAKPGEWIIGRGWHQEKWDAAPIPNVLGYPYHDALSKISPNNPVVLRHASGHSLFANAKAMELAGVSRETPSPSGGEIVRDSRGKAIGVFEERAMGVIGAVYQEYLNTLPEAAKKAEWMKGAKLAQKECLKKGVTSFQDAGSKLWELDYYRELAETGKLDLRMWVMIRQTSDELKGKLQGFPWVNLGKFYLTVRAIKSDVDGALGSYGAWLLKPYNDKTGFVGQNTTPIAEVEAEAKLAAQNNLQLCVHAIGDRANREVLNIFEKEALLHPNQKDTRWRIEHAQHLDTADIPRFKKLGVIAAMQGIHCTSDAPFVIKRLGLERARLGAYPWRALLDAGAVVGNGTDVPVEDVDPIESFYASVTRRRADTGLLFFPEQKMTRQEAVYSYTAANAFAAFEEKDKGVLEAGKLADIVVLSNNLLTCKDEDILKTKVIMTIVGGKVKYKK